MTTSEQLKEILNELSQGIEIEILAYHNCMEPLEYISWSKKEGIVDSDYEYKKNQLLNGSEFPMTEDKDIIKWIKICIELNKNKMNDMYSGLIKMGTEMGKLAKKKKLKIVN